MVSKTDCKFSRIFNRLTNLPTLPEVANKLIQLSEEEANPARLAEIIETDPGTTAKVLKLVNSAFYSLKNPVANLSHAVGLLGGRTVKSLVLSVSAMQVFKRRCRGFDQMAFWRNSFVTAMVSRRIAEATMAGDPDLVEEGYISGLLHAGGIPLYVQFFPDDYAGILERGSSGGHSLLELEEEEFGAGHPEAGGEIAKHWRFPERIATVIRFHRFAPEELPDVDPDARKLIDIVHVADLWARRAGIAFCEADHLGEAESVSVPEWFGLDEEALVGESIGDVNELVAGLESLFR